MIITVPHPTLRQAAKPVEQVNEELVQLIQDLEMTLATKDHPKGVGLSAPQINQSLRVFTTLLDQNSEEGDAETPVMRSFINPEIMSVSKEKTFGDDPQHPILEGCLSIPGIYGPVPRYAWVEYSYQEIENGKLVKKYATFYDFEARVMQHEYDHLEGVLFTDYTLKFDLPLYDDKDGKLKLTKSSVAKKF